LDESFFEVLEWKRYHLGVLDKPSNFQGGGENIQHFMGIFLRVPFPRLNRAKHVHLFQLESTNF
jgi:hypothetical protein